jgi:hypothetical protein
MKLVCIRPDHEILIRPVQGAWLEMAPEYLDGKVDYNTASYGLVLVELRLELILPIICESITRRKMPNPF